MDGLTLHNGDPVNDRPAAVDADAHWFDDNPQRRHRMRWATQIEIDQCSDGLTTDCPPGFFVAMVIKAYTPGVRTRLPVYWQGSFPSGEDAVREVFDWSQDPAHEKQMQALAQEYDRLGGAEK